MRWSSLASWRDTFKSLLEHRVHTVPLETRHRYSYSQTRKGPDEPVELSAHRPSKQHLENLGTVFAIKAEEFHGCG